MIECENNRCPTPIIDCTTPITDYTNTINHTTNTPLNYSTFIARFFRARRRMSLWCVRTAFWSSAKGRQW